MLSQRPYLNIRQPSPTAIEYVVSTAPLYNSVTLQLARIAALLFRLVLGLGSLFVLVAIRNVSILPTERTPLERNVLGNIVGEKSIELVQGTQWWILTGILVLCSFLIVRRGYTEESLLVLRGLGIQTSTSSSFYFFRPQTRFMPTELIQDIFIHEAFIGFSVRFYLAVLLTSEEEAVVVFPKLLPQRAILEEIWRGARQCLYESKD